MTDGEKPGGAGAGKIVLIVVLVLLGLGLVCCVGAWFMGGRHAVEIGFAASGMTDEIRKDLGEKTAITFFPDDEGRMVLVLAFPDAPDAERIEEFQDKAWKAYATAFAKGGLDIEAVGVGKVAPGKTGIAGWKANSVPVSDVVSRTGVAAPPRAAWMDKFDKGTLRIGSDEGEIQIETGDDTGDEPK